MFDWNQLPSSESGWKLSAMQKQKIIENCTQKRGPLFWLRFKPFLAPAVGVLATCAAVFTFFYSGRGRRAVKMLLRFRARAAKLPSRMNM